MANQMVCGKRLDKRVLRLQSQILEMQWPQIYNLGDNLDNSQIMKSKNTVIVALLLTIICLGFWIRAERQTLKDELRFQIALNDALCRLTEKGDFQKIDLQNIRPDLRMELLGAVRLYERQFGDETGTNSFARHFADAKAIANQEESQLVPISSILTNLPHTPDAKITLEQK
jgi:hypothetical protein